MAIYRVYTADGAFFGVEGPLGAAQNTASAIGGYVGEEVQTGGAVVDIWEDIGQTDEVMPVTATDILVDLKPFVPPPPKTTNHRSELAFWYHNDDWRSYGSR